MLRSPLANCVPAFGRHGSYPLRLGWLAKAHSAVRDDPLVFSHPDAPVVLGVGKSMVRAIRFWSRAFGLTHDGDRSVGGRLATVTERGWWLMDEDQGADPYLEDRATLWLLHWWLLTARPCHVPTFRFLFGHWWMTRFTRGELRLAVQRAAVATGWRQPSKSLITRDITALTAMYACHRPPGGRITTPDLEELLSNPFRQLGLLDTDPDHAGMQGQLTASRGSDLMIHRHQGTTAPQPILACACLEHAHATGVHGPGSITLARLHTDPLGPGRLMLTDHNALYTALTWAANHPLAGHIAISESAVGEDLLTFDAPPLALAKQLLADYYHHPDGPT